MSVFPLRRRHAAFAPIVLCLLAGSLAGCAQAPTAESTVAAADHAVADPVERGRYLVALGACSDCHTPMKMGDNGPEPDMARFLSGHPEGMEMTPAPALDGMWVYAGSATNTAFVGPWGTTYAFNLTPDENTGLGIWTEEMFVDAIRTGKHMGQSRPIMPPMPWPAYSQATDEDLKAIYAYLRTIPAIVNRVPEYQPPATPPAVPAG